MGRAGTGISACTPGFAPGEGRGFRSAQCVTGPSGQSLAVVEYFGGNFVIGLQGLFRARFEGAAVAGGVVAYGRRGGFEVELAFVDDGEEGVVAVEAVCAEHGTALEAGEVAELVEDEVFEGGVGHGVVSLPPGGRVCSG